jgi:flagellar assembly factor FliW
MDADYQIGITIEDLCTLGLDENRQPVPGVEVLCVAIVSVPEQGGLTANLLAPVVVNLKTRVGVQAVRNDAVYSHCRPIGTSAEASVAEPSCS